MVGWRAGGGAELTIDDRHTRAGVHLQKVLGGNRGAVWILFLNGDGTVGGPDLTIILSNWGGCP